MYAGSKALMADANFNEGDSLRGQMGAMLGQMRQAERSATESSCRADRLQRLASVMSQEESRDRRRLAQMVHDHLQQALVGARLKLGAIRRCLSGQPVTPQLDQVDDLLRSSIEASRGLAAELSPPILYEGSLAQALEWLARRCRERESLSLAVRAAQPLAVNQDAAVLLFESAGELVSNVIEHAGVKSASIEVRPGREGGVELSVHDQGTGFDPALISESTKGLGLFGLGERLALYGGHLSIESTPGRGTRVTVRLPRSATEPAPIGASPQVAVTEPQEQEWAPAAPGRISVLLADDHRIVREGLAGLLAQEPDIELVGEAADGLIAVDMTLRLHPQVVIMDVSMPRLNGLAASRRITASLPQTKIIALSAHEEGDMAREMLSAGATAYLTKGGPAEDLLTAIRHAVGDHLTAA